MIVGVGITPNTALASAAGLQVDNGIVTDAALRTSVPDIFAAGDVANAFHPLVGKHIRVEHWANARHQPVAAAKAMLGQDVAYDRVPYFYTDQYDLGMEYAGYVEPGGYAEVVFRGDVPGREFVAFWLGDDGRVLAGMNVNIWDVNDAIGALVRSGKPVSKDALTDPRSRWTPWPNHASPPAWKIRENRNGHSGGCWSLPGRRASSPLRSLPVAQLAASCRAPLLAAAYGCAIHLRAPVWMAHSDVRPGRLTGRR